MAELPSGDQSAGQTSPCSSVLRNTHVAKDIFEIKISHCQWMPQGAKETDNWKARVGVDVRAERGQLVCAQREKTNTARKQGPEEPTLDQSNGLLDRSTDGQVVDGDLAGDALGVDEEQASEGDPVLGEEDAVLGCHRVVLVRELAQSRITATLYQVSNDHSEKGPIADAREEF